MVITGYNGMMFMTYVCHVHSANISPTNQPTNQ
jgi:hypothetical protein